MNRGVRHKVQRSRRVKLKHDTVILLDRIAVQGADIFPDKLKLQIAELRMRLQPPTGCKAPIIHTDFAKGYRLD